ncbi:UNVERIFIED_CONTAM: hypothetical protein Sradi_5859000 [Sesamum radiatum]|uniref:Reverse transcriptase domain-containing protein n=1 Tax=Sesamum radiatum TaxID=300843 RepID=A0AAW2KQD2_SESRA
MTGIIQEEIFKERPWLLHIDRSSTTQGSGAGVVITSPQGGDMEFAIKFNFKASNNEVEYEALYEANEESMVQYLQRIEELKTKLRSFQLQQIPREENVKADSLSKLASTLEDCKTRHITMQNMPQPRISLNIQGPFPLATEQRKFLLVAIDYFTKWVETESLTRIIEGEVLKFVWKNIIYRFGLHKMGRDRISCPYPKWIR